MEKWLRLKRLSSKREPRYRNIGRYIKMYYNIHNTLSKLKFWRHWQLVFLFQSTFPRACIYDNTSSSGRSANVITLESNVGGKRQQICIYTKLLTISVKRILYVCTTIWCIHFCYSFVCSKKIFACFSLCP